MTTRANGKTTAADLRAQPAGRWEVVRGRLVEKPAPSFGQIDAMLGAAAILRPAFHHAQSGPEKDSPSGPGGWWIVGGCELELDVHEVYRPELVGWRRSRLPTRPYPIMTVRPDWVCEIVAGLVGGSGELLARRRVYELVEVPAYWRLDLDAQVLEVYRLARAGEDPRGDGYVLMQAARPGEVVRAEPFAEVELAVSALISTE